MRQRGALLGLFFLIMVVALAIATHITLSDRARATSEIREELEPARYQTRTALTRMAAGASERDVLATFRGVSNLLGDHSELADNARALEETASAGFESSQQRAVLLNELREFHAKLQEKQEAAQSRLLAAESQLLRVLWAVLVLGLGLAAAAGWFTQRWVSAPLDQIASAADRVRDGDLHRPIPVVGVPELRGLAGNVERMRARIVGLLDTSRRATEALGQQGVAVVRLGEELGPSGQGLPAGVHFAAGVEPAEGVLAGDWYDCLDLGDGRIALAIVDVSGHGPEAGIFALRVKNLLSAALRDGRAPGAALGWLAGHLGDTGERFLTAFVAEVDPATGHCRWASAGHPPAAVLARGSVRQLGATGPLLGPLPGRWRTESTRLPVDATLIAYTDGLIEARDEGEQFGDERLRDTLRAAEGQEPAEVVDACVRAVRDFAGGRATDDITVVALARSERTVAAPRVQHDGGPLRRSRHPSTL